jgi:hypothetical protein
MPAIMADHDIEGQMQVLLRLLTSAERSHQLTISAPQRILSSRAYARRMVERLLEYLIDVENLRGTGRLYLP